MRRDSALDVCPLFLKNSLNLTADSILPIKLNIHSPQFDRIFPAISTISLEATNWYWKAVTSTSRNPNMNPSKIPVTVFYSVIDTSI